MAEKMNGREPAESNFWSGALFGMLTGMASLLAFQYFTAILRNPRLVSRQILLDGKTFDTQDAMAMFIASENLQYGILPRRLADGSIRDILHAGYRNFRESWARDFGFAAYGLLALEKYKVVQDTLEAFFFFQRRDGQFPVKLHSLDPITRFFHSRLGREQSIDARLRPKYVSAHGAPSLDGQALLVISALTYFRKTNDKAFLTKYWDSLRLAMDWLEGFHRTTDDVLLYQGAFADWADSIARRGHVIYTNVVYWKALTEMALAAESMDFKADTEFYKKRALAVANAIQEQLWRPDLGYFVTSESLDELSSDGNLLAIAWGLANPDQAWTILKVMKDAYMDEPVPTRVAYPSYPPELVALENHLAGVANYHTDSSWLWLGAWHVVALLKNGQHDEAARVLSHISEVIVRDQKVNEAHGPDGRPLASFWYSFESPLIWNAGMVIYAYHTFEREKGTQVLIPITALGRKVP